MKLSLIFSSFIIDFVAVSDGSGNNEQSTNCIIRSNGLKTIGDVQNAIDNARGGDTIRLDPIVYNGDLLIRSDQSETITILGDSQCKKSTEIIGRMTITSSNWNIDSLVIKNTESAVVVKNGNNIRIKSLVLDQISGNGVEVDSGRDITVEKLVAERIGRNVLDFSGVSNIEIRSVVIKNVGGVGLSFDNCEKITLTDTVADNCNMEVIKITGSAATGPSNSRRTGSIEITNTVISGDSREGQGWMYLEGDNYYLKSNIGSGRPANGFVINGCNNEFDSNICTLKGSGYCFYLLNKSCPNNFGLNNFSSGGRGIRN